MSTKEWANRIHHILDEIRAAEAHIRGKSKEDLLQDITIRRALERSIEIIGEAATHIPADIRAKYSSIPWRVMIGMRNKLIHDYEDVDNDVLWLTAIDDLPQLATAIQAIKLDDMKD